MYARLKKIFSSFCHNFRQTHTYRQTCLPSSRLQMVCFVFLLLCTISNETNQIEQGGKIFRNVYSLLLLLFVFSFSFCLLPFIFVRLLLACVLGFMVARDRICVLAHNWAACYYSIGYKFSVFVRQFAWFLCASFFLLLFAFDLMVLYWQNQ